MALTPEEFDHLFLEASDMLYSQGMRLFRNEDDTMDFCQDVYVHTKARRDQFLGEAKFSTWLYTAALRLGLNKLRKNKKFTSLGESDGEEGFDNPITMIPSGELSALDNIIRTEIRETVQEEIYKLPDIYRVPLVLYYFDKMQYEEIAAELEVKIGTVKSWIHRGKHMLREHLEKRGIV